MLTLIALVIAILFLPSPWNVILVAVTAVVDAIELGVLVWWSRYRRRLGPATVGIETIVGRSGVALQRLDPVGQVSVDGEIWKARAAEPIERDVAVTVVAVDRLVLSVEQAPRA
jgi:membrane-bound serine protease (ClpP class)